MLKAVYRTTPLSCTLNAACCVYLSVAQALTEALSNLQSKASGSFMPSGHEDSTHAGVPMDVLSAAAAAASAGAANLLNAAAAAVQPPQGMDSQV